MPNVVFVTSAHGSIRSFRGPSGHYVLPALSQVHTEIFEMTSEQWLLNPLLSQNLLNLRMLMSNSRAIDTCKSVLTSRSHLHFLMLHYYQDEGKSQCKSGGIVPGWIRTTPASHSAQKPNVERRIQEKWPPVLVCFVRKIHEENVWIQP
jgi:hypothetical protein